VASFGESTKRNYEMNKCLSLVHLIGCWTCHAVRLRLKCYSELHHPTSYMSTLRSAELPKDLHWPTSQVLSAAARSATSACRPFHDLAGVCDQNSICRVAIWG